MKINEVELSYKHSVEQSEMPIINASDECYKILKKQVYNKKTIQHHEQSYILLLNDARKLLGIFKVSDGGISGATVDVRLILQAVLLSNATGLILTHNHPSGDYYPSLEDIEITKKLRLACETMNIQLLDHMIITSGGYYSFSDRTPIEKP